MQMIRRTLLLGIAALVVFGDQSPLCPPKWTFSEMHSACYYVYPGRLSWKKAGEFCRAIGANLTSIDGVDEEALLLDLLKTPLLTWTSLHRQNNSDTFYYGDSSRVFEKWAAGEPSRVGDCGGLINTGSANQGAKVGDCESQQPFICQKIVKICGNGFRQTGVDGSISSPNYPNRYPSRLKCKYVMTGPPGTYISIRFDHALDIRDIDDVIMIYDGDSTDRKNLISMIIPVIKYSLVYRTRQNAMTIVFETTYENLNRNGWTAKWTAIPDTHDINFIGNSGSLTSDQYPNEYRPYLRQFYYIQTEEGKTITATFNHFDTEVDHDNLVIYNGPTLLERGVRKNISGSFPDSFMPIVHQTERKYLTIEFTTNGRIQKSGWNMTWVAN